MNVTQPMSGISGTILPSHYERLIELAEERGLVTKKGRPIIAAALREVLAEVFDDQGGEVEEANGGDE